MIDFLKIKDIAAIILVLDIAEGISYNDMV